jgi:hypothetical protein
MLNNVMIFMLILMVFTGCSKMDLDPKELTIKSLTKEVDRLSEENFNLSLVKGKNGQEN